MRWLATILLFLVFSGSALADSPRFNAGVSRLTVPDDVTTIDTVVFYPTNAPEISWQAGPFTIEASRDAVLIADKRFPVVLISHGHLGGPLSHRELATALARAGFIVILPTHVGDASGFALAQTQAQILINRPRQAEAALNAVLLNPRFSGSVDTNRIGMIGYSAGGYTALILAGATPNFSYAGAYCANHDDPGSCPHSVPGTASGMQVQLVPSELLTWHPPVEHRLKALVLMDPLAIMFEPSSFSSVRLPSLLYRPQSDAYLGATRNVLAVASGLPLPAILKVVPGKHFVFIDPCPSQLAGNEPLICQDGPGVDRPVIHRQMEKDIADFLQANL